MDNYWFNKLMGVLQVQTNSENEKLMVLYLDKELRELKLPYYIDAAGNVHVTKGKAKIYPCVVSHMDTVHKFVPNFEICQDIDNKDLLFAVSGEQRVGIGGDDKCGIFACLYLLKVIPQIKVVFFSREEDGCRGSRGINKSFFDDCSYLIQLDRRGKRDFIQTYWNKKTVSHEFSSEIGLIKKKYKYKNQTGTVTDVMKLWDSKVGVSCVNLSCGYYEPHSNNEYISITDLWYSIKFTEEILYTLQSKRFVSLPPKPVVTPVSYATGSNYKLKYDKCDKCKAWKTDKLLYNIKGNHGKKICWPCKHEEARKKHNKKVLCKDTSAKGTSDIILFACYECGIKTSELTPGDSIREVNGHLYCSGCASVLSNNEKGGVICEVCQEVIPKDHYRTMIQTMLVCGECANDLRKYTDNKCFVCNKEIPKDAKIIERFGVRVCEDCACPSDIVVDSKGKRLS